MSSAVVKISEFNASNLSVGQLKTLESGGKMASLGYAGGKFTTQIGPLSLPYGMNVFDKAGPVKYSMDLSLRGYDDNPKIRAIYDAFMALDEFMIDQGVKNSRAWFKADLNRDVVKAFYTPMVKIAKDADGNPKPYPPTIKINLRKQGDSFEVKVYDEQKRPYEGVPLEDLLVKGASLTTLIQCTSVWFAGSKFGLSWKALQIRMDKVPESIRGYAFVDDDDSSSNRAAAGKAPAPVSNQNRFAELDEDEVEEEEAAAPAPAPAKKQSVLSAMMPQAPAPAPVAAPTLDDDAEDFEPVAVPKKPTTITTKKIVKKSVAGK